MDDGLRNIDVFPDHFHASTPIAESAEKKIQSAAHSRTNNSFRYLYLNKQGGGRETCKALNWFFSPSLLFYNNSHSCSWARRKLRTAALMLNMFSIRGLPWGSSSDDQEKVDCMVSISLVTIEIPISLGITMTLAFQVELTVTELEYLRTELSSLEEREAHLKAQ